LTLANYVACVELVFVDYIILVYDVMTMFYNVPVFDYLLGSRAVENLLLNRVLVAT
jgi:hypothetical protein